MLSLCNLNLFTNQSSKLTANFVLGQINLETRLIKADEACLSIIHEAHWNRREYISFI